MNYSDICERLLRKHFCLPGRWKSTKHTEHCLYHTDSPCRPYPSSPDALGAIQSVSLRVRPCWEPQLCTGVFSIWSLSIFLCFDEVAIHHLMKMLEEEAFSCGLVLCRQMQTPPSSSSFLKKLGYKLLLKLNICSIWNLYIIFYLFSGEHNSKWSNDQFSTAPLCPVPLMWSPFYGLKDKHSLRLWRSCYKWHG